MEPSVQFLQGHVAIRLNDSIMVVKLDETQEVQGIWTYNLWTEQWTDQPVPQGKQLQSTDYQCAVVIESVIYLFGGHTYLNYLSKLTRNTNSFEWSTIHPEEGPSQIPSPRKYHSGWTYEDKMWIFAGSSFVPPDNFLHDHGHFAGRLADWQNNQLFSYDPSVNKWKNVQCFGDTPSPRSHASVAIVTDKVWLYGGHAAASTGWGSDLYELNMHSLTWTQIDTCEPRPLALCPSLTPVTVNQLLLRGNRGAFSSMWILDVQSHTWSKHQLSDFTWIHHTSTKSLNSNALFLGRRTPIQNIHSSFTCSPISSVMLEPKSLQQLAMGDYISKQKRTGSETFTSVIDT